MVDKLKLLMGRPLGVSDDNSISVKQPLVQDIVNFGEDSFNELLLPFVLTTDSVFNGVENEEELIKRFDFFDLFFVEIEEGKYLLDNVFGGKKSLDLLETALRYFLQADEIRILHKRQKISVDNTYLIDKVEFNKLRIIIQAVTGRKDVEVEKPPKNMTKRQKEIWMKLKKGRKRTAEKNAIYLQDIINFIQFGGSSYISYEQIDKMTYFQLQNAYKSVIGKDSFEIGMGYKLSQKFEVKDDIKHWTDSLKIGK